MAKYVAIGKRGSKREETDTLRQAFLLAMEDPWTGAEFVQVIDDDGNVVYDSDEDGPIEDWITANPRRFEHWKGE